MSTCVCACACVYAMCVSVAPPPSSLLGGFPYATLPNQELLPNLFKGYRLESPDKCSEEM